MTIDSTHGDFAARCAALTAKTPPPAAAEPRPRATNRRERLACALDVMARAGITGSAAYAPALRGLARAGLIVKPFFFWNPVLLFLFSVVFFTTLFAGTALVCLAMGVMPRPVVAMIEAGPVVFAWVMGGLSLFFTGVHFVKAQAAGLPRWRDL